MPRWWPGVGRMEGVEEDRFTQVFKTKKGRPVRADFRVVGPSRRAGAVLGQELDRDSVRAGAGRVDGRDGARARPGGHAR